MKKKFLEHRGIIIIVIIALFIRLLVMFELGIMYSLGSDDVSYINSGIEFLKNGSITMHGVISAQIMPGMTFLIAIFSFIFGEGIIFWLFLKLFWIAMGLLSIVYLYKIITMYTPKIYGCIGALFLLAVDFAWMDNLILTETPFMLSTILLLYYSLKYCNTKNNNDYFLIIIYYIVAVMFRPTIAPYPMFFIIYLLISKHTFKELFKKIIFAFAVVLIVFVPWSIRNYILFDRFIPLTYGVGNPLLLGTYQGKNYPKDEKLDYETNVDDKMTTEMKEYLLENKTEKSYMKKYYSLEYDKLKADYRMSVWWRNDPGSMLKSYLFYKPKILLYNSFYWKEVLNLSKSFNLLIRKIDIMLFLVSSIAIIVNKKYIKELIFISSIYFFQIAVYSYSFAFDRYGQTLLFYRFIIIGIGLKIFYDYIKNINIKYLKQNDFQ